ncbi:HNH endonuclease [Aeromicrobium sp. Sec7.5]|uniref:HNH endonuclease n=1 Tax=Aeromicrobium sp. Sec7.5 TaxID=3121276 RepID=UPI002FE42EB6
MVSGPTVQALRSAAHAVTSADHRAALVAIQTAQDALDAAKAHHLAELEKSAEFELDGASTVTTWARQHLRLDARQTRSLIDADHTMRELPAVGDAAAEGAVRLDHVRLFTFGLKHIGQKVVSDAEPWLLAVATTHEPVQLRRVIRALRDAVYPEELDKAWIKGMAKEDIQLSPVPEGWHLSGFLKTETGAKLKAVLESLSIPTQANDDRTSAERRVAGFDRLLSSVLESGLPSSKGIRPQLSVIVGVETLHEAMTAEPGQAKPVGEPAELAGFGPIGPQLLSYLACTGDTTPILTSDDDVEQAQILNVGDTIRLATPAQRKAVIARQHGVCAAPGCTHTHLEIHHTTWWSNGGKTDLDGLIGICTSCHTLVHRGLLVIEALGQGKFDLATRDGRPVDLTQRRTTRDQLRRIRHAARQTHEAQPADYPLRA